MQVALQNVPKSETFNIDLAARLLSDYQFSVVQDILYKAVQVAREKITE